MKRCKLLKEDSRLRESINLLTFADSSTNTKKATALVSFSCYESPRRVGDAAVGGLVIDRVKQIFLSQNNLFFVSSYYVNLRKSLFD